MRLIVEEWKTASAGLRENVIFYPEAIEPGDTSSDAPRWADPKGSDVFLALEIQKANRLLADGPRTYSHVCAVADRLAFAIVARDHGVETTARALRAGRSLLTMGAKVPSMALRAADTMETGEMSPAAITAALFRGAGSSDART
jgi:hypothetical protein